MTEEQKLEIARLRKLGWGFKQIGQALDIDRDAVRDYCKDQALNSSAVQQNDNEQTCLNCGKPFVKNIEGRARKYCSDRCRRICNAKHSKFYQHQCQFCGKLFESKAAKQKYCDNECYVKDRFWRKENVTQIAECLVTGEKPEFIPQWIKEVIASWEDERKEGDLQ